MDCSTLLLILTLLCWVLSKVTSSTIFLVFGISWPRFGPRSPGPFSNTLLIRPMASDWLFRRFTTLQCCLISFNIYVIGDMECSLLAKSYCILANKYPHKCLTHDREYIYIVIHRLTVSLCPNSSVWLDASNLADFTSVGLPPQEPSSFSA